MVMVDVTRILDALNEGEDSASKQLLEAVYEELRSLASIKLFKERSGQTLQATALVHEAWIRLVGNQRSDWRSRGHFFGAAAEAMRRILVERARRKACLKHGGGQKRVMMDPCDIIDPPPGIDLIALDEALDKFAAEDPIKTKLVKLRFFTGLTLEQVSQVLGISKATADRYWFYARAWLYHEIKKGDDLK